MGGHRAHRAPPRRAARRDDQPHLSRRAAEFQDFQRHGRAFALRRPVHHARQGVARRRAARRRCRADLPAQARAPVLDRHHRGHRATGATLDVVRDGRLVGADRPRCHAAGDALPDHAVGCDRSPIMASASFGSTPSGTSSRSPARPASWSSRRSTSSSTGSTEVADSFGLVVLPEVHDRYATHERLTRHGYWTYDFVLPGLLLHAFETGDGGSPGGAPGPLARPAVHRASTATTASPFVRTSTASSSRRRCSTWPIGSDGEAETSTGSCPARTRPRSMCTN